MSNLYQVLTHPSRWSTLEGLAPDERALVALVVLLVTAGAAFLSSRLSAAWARRRDAAKSDGAARAAAKVQRGFSTLVAILGVYLAVEVAPLPPRVDRVLSGIAFVLGALFAARLVIHLATLLIGTSVVYVHTGERERLEREYVPLVEKVTGLAVALVGIIVVAKHFGQDVTSLVAALGVGSLAIGLAAQQTLGNMIAGFTLLVDRPFRPGDRIQLATGEAGDVLEIGVRSTRIVLPSRNLLIVPNAELVNSRVINFQHPTPSARGEVKLTMSYDADVERAVAILVELAASDERVAKTPAPVGRVVDLGNVGVDLSLSFEVTSHPDVVPVQDQLRRRILNRFKTEKIDLPFPRTDVYLLNRSES